MATRIISCRKKKLRAMRRRGATGALIALTTSIFAYAAIRNAPQTPQLLDAVNAFGMIVLGYGALRQRFTRSAFMAVMACAIVIGAGTAIIDNAIGQPTTPSAPR